MPIIISTVLKIRHFAVIACFSLVISGLAPNQCPAADSAMLVPAEQASGGGIPLAGSVPPLMEYHVAIDGDHSADGKSYGASYSSNGKLFLGRFIRIMSAVPAAGDSSGGNASPGATAHNASEFSPGPPAGNNGGDSSDAFFAGKRLIRFYTGNSIHDARNFEPFFFDAGDVGAGKLDTRQDAPANAPQSGRAPPVQARPEQPLQAQSSQAKAEQAKPGQTHTAQTQPVRTQSAEDKDEPAQGKAEPAQDKAEPAQDKGEQVQAAQARPAPRNTAGELSRIGWKTLNPNQVQIAVELDRNVSWRARRMQTKNPAGPSSLVLELQGALPGEQVRDGARVSGSPLSAVRVDAASREQTRLFFDFTGLAEYEMRVEQEPFKIILDVQVRDATAAQRAGSASEQNDNAPAARVAGQVTMPVAASKDLALQLGLTVQKVFLDAGHGGRDPGTGHHGLVEKDVALDVVKRVGKLLQKQGIDVQYSRAQDVHLSLGERTRMANEARADLFVSLHVNASPDAQVAGFETYYLDVASNTDAARLAAMENTGSDKKMGDLTAILADFMLNACMQESRQLARTLQRAVMSRMGKQRYGTRDGGVKAAPLYVLIGTGMPAVLAELGYCSNQEEARHLAGADYRQSLAEGMVEGILAYRNTLLRKQAVDLKAPDANPNAKYLGLI